MAFKAHFSLTARVDKICLGAFEAIVRPSVRLCDDDAAPRPSARAGERFRRTVTKYLAEGPRRHQGEEPIIVGRCHKILGGGGYHRILWAGTTGCLGGGTIAYYGEVP